MMPRCEHFYKILLYHPLSTLLFANAEMPLILLHSILQKITNDESTGRKSNSRGAKERAGICENKQAPGASHRRLNLTDLWFDGRLPRQRSLVPGLEMESHLRELRQNVSLGHERFPRLSSFPFLHPYSRTLVPCYSSFLPFAFISPPHRFSFSISSISPPLP